MCKPFYEEGTAPPEFANLGICGLPVALLPGCGGDSVTTVDTASDTGQSTVKAVTPGGGRRVDHRYADDRTTDDRHVGWHRCADGKCASEHAQHRRPRAAERPCDRAPASPRVNGRVHGGTHGCARLDGGQVKCWGNPSGGLTGSGDNQAHGDEPNEMGASLPFVYLGKDQVVAVPSGGTFHNCALLAGGGLKCWGSNSGGALGLGDVESRGDDPNEMGDMLPLVDLGQGQVAAAVTVGGNFTCALLGGGTVKCWVSQVVRTSYYPSVSATRSPTATTRTRWGTRFRPSTLALAPRRSRSTPVKATSAPC